MTILQVALGISHLTTSQLADKLDSVGGAMTNNPTFPNPAVPPADLLKAGSDIRAKAAAKSAAEVALHTATSELHAAKTKGHDLLVKEGHFVAIAADGDEAKAKSAGMDLRPKAVHAHSVPVPAHVSVELGTGPHEAAVHWHGGRVAKGPVHEFQVWTTTDPSKVDSWALAGATDKSMLVAGNLAPGAHSFRVVAVGADSVSPPSGVVTVYVP